MKVLGNADIADVGERRTSQLIGSIVLALVVIVVLAVAGRFFVDPSLATKDVPIATIAVLSLGLVFTLNRTRFYRPAAFSSASSSSGSTSSKASSAPTDLSGTPSCPCRPSSAEGSSGFARHSSCPCSAW